MIYPIAFIDRTCCACGCTDSLRFEQENGRISKNPIYSITKFVCVKCATEYFIKWIPEQEGDNSKLIPVATSDNAIEAFESNIIEYSQRYKRKIDFGGLA